MKAAVAAEHHRLRECPEKDMHKRIIDVLGEGPPPGIDVYHLPPSAMPPRVFRCRACGWSITEEPTS